MRSALVLGLMLASSGARAQTALRTHIRGIAVDANGRVTALLLGWQRLAIAVFVTDAKADEMTREAVIARIARAAYDAALTSSRVHRPTG